MDQFTDAEAYALSAEQIVGANLSAVELYGSMLHVRCSTGACLQLWDPWRITNGQQIFGSSDIDVSEAEDPIPVNRESVPWLRFGSSIENLEITPPFHDLRIVFGDGSSIERFSDGAQYECWYLLWDVYERGGTRKHLVCSGTAGFSLFG